MLRVGLALILVSLCVDSKLNKPPQVLLPIGVDRLLTQTSGILDRRRSYAIQTGVPLLSLNYCFDILSYLDRVRPITKIVSFL